MSLARKAAFSTFIVFTFSILAAALGYVVRIIMARGLLPADYGLFYAIFTMFSFLVIFSNLGLDEALSKLIPDFLVEKDYPSVKGLILIVIALQLSVFGICAIAIIVFARQIGLSYFHSAAAITPIIILAIAFWVRPVGTALTNAFRGFQKLQYYTLFNVLKLFLVAIFISFFFARGASSITIASFAYLFSFTLIPIILTPFFLKVFPQFFRTKARITRHLFKRIISFSFPAMIAMVGSSILIYSDTLILTYFRTLEEVGLYQVAYPTSNILLYFPSAICAMILPLSSELWARKEKEKLRIGTNLLYKYSLLLMIPLAILVASFSKSILTTLFGQAYEAATLPLVILSAGSVIYAIGIISATILSGIGKPKINSKIVLIAAVTNIALNLVVIPRYGIVGAAITTVIGYTIILVLTLVKIKEHIHVHIPLALWGRYAASASLFILFVLGLKELIPLVGIVEFLLIAPLSIILYVPMVFLLGIMTQEDVVFLKRTLFGRNVGPPDETR